MRNGKTVKWRAHILLQFYHIIRPTKDEREFLLHQATMEEFKEHLEKKGIHIASHNDSAEGLRGLTIKHIYVE